MSHNFVKNKGMDVEAIPPTRQILQQFLFSRRLTQVKIDAYNRFVEEALPNMFLKEFSYRIIYDRTFYQWHVFQIHDMYLVKTDFC